jgi:hypothetical protein
MGQSVVLEMLPADYGDALYFHYGTDTERHHIWIDGGLAQSFKKGWGKRIRQLGKMGMRLDLLVVTHIDADHIGGTNAFVDANQQGKTPPSIIPIREVWFNQYRHIRAYGPAGPGRDDPHPADRPRWQTSADLLAEISTVAPYWGRLAAHLAKSAAAKFTPEAVARGIADGQELGGLLEGHYRSNTRFGDQAVVRTDIPPVVDLPGGARVWVLSPSPEKLKALYSLWDEYLREEGLSSVLGVRGMEAPGTGDALVPAFVHALTLRARGTFESPLKGRDDDLVLPIKELAQRAFEEDDSVANGSSIGLLFEYAGHRLLLAGDAHPSVLAEGLRQLGYSPQTPLELDAFKLCHHGSRANTSPELLELLRCSRYMISTNGVRFNHPDKECLARIVWANRAQPPVMFYFNYATTAAEKALTGEDDQARYGYHIAHLGPGESLTCG